MQIICQQCRSRHNSTIKFCSECGFRLKSKEVETSKEKKTSDNLDIVDAKRYANEWSCEHCTFLNNSDSNICMLCYKTSATRMQAKNSPASVPVPTPNPASTPTSIPPDIKVTRVFQSYFIWLSQILTVGKRRFCVIFNCL